VNNVMNAIAAAAVAASFTAPAPASASVDTKGLRSEILSAAGSDSDVVIRIEGDTLTLDGFVKNGYAAFAAERAATRIPGVKTVINNLFNRA